MELSGVVAVYVLDVGAGENELLDTYDFGARVIGGAWLFEYRLSFAPSISLSP